MSEYVILIVGVALALLFAVLANHRLKLALLACPLVVAVLIGWAIYTESVWGLLGALLVVVATVLSALLARGKSELGLWARGFTKFFFYILGVGICVPLGLFVIGPYGFFMLAMLSAMIVRYNLVSRDTTTTHIFSTIGASMRQNLPLATALESAAQGLKGKRRLIMQRISQWLTRGYPLSEALRSGYSRCPGYALAMVAAAERIQQVPQAVSYIEAQLSEKSREARKFQPANLAYPLVLMLAVFAFIYGMAIFILPQFESMYEGLEQPLPAITRAVFFLFGSSFSLIFAVLALLILVVVPSALYVKFRPRRPERAYVVSRIGDFVKWHFPVLRWFERSFSLLQTVSFLRLSINAGGTVDQAIAGAAELDANGCYRRRLRRWLERVQGGQDVAEAGRESRVGSTLVWAFDQKVNRGNTPAILESLESFYRSNYSYITNLARYIVWPCVSIVLGLVVGAVIYAIFSPIVGLLHHTIDTMIP